MRNYKIHLLRHGLTTAHAEGRYAGATNSPLTAKGRAELEDLRQHRLYPTVGWVISSPLVQAVDSAKLLYPGQEFREDTRWREMHFGDFEGKSLTQLANDPRYAHWIAHPGEAPPGGESSQALFERVCSGLEGLFQEMMDTGVFSAAVVTHGGVIGGLLSTFGLPEMPPGQWACPPGHGYTIFMTPQMWMRYRKFEIFAPIPQITVREGQEEDTSCC